MLKIPKIIHQIWWEIDSPLPKQFRKFGDTWKDNHPDWKYEFWDQERSENFIADFYPQYINKFQSFQYNIQRIDAIRYLILDKIGGMYVDFDSECIRPHDEIFSGKSCCFAMEPESHRLKFNLPYLFTNALVACIPEHPFMKKIIESVFSYIPKTEKFPEGLRRMEILNSTGPFLLVNTYKKYQEKEQVFLIPAKYVSPFDMNEIALIRRGYKSKVFDMRLKNAYSIHYFWGSWWM